MPLNSSEGIYTCKNTNSTSKTKKFLTIIITVLLLMIPIAFISGIISDREDYRTKAIEQISTSWADEQKIDPPTMYYTDYTKNNERENIYFCRTDYNVTANVNTEIRQKGIFKIPVYIADITITGNFTNKIGDISKKNTIIEFGISDTRGFVDEPVLKIANQKPLKLNSTKVNIKIDSTEKQIPFEISYKIKGLNKLEIFLGGTNNTVSMQSNWKTPSFEGSYLPTYRELTNNGFNAKWSVPNIALENSDDIPAYITVSYLVPVDSYKMTERVLKYSFLLLTLTFLCYFIFEITSKQEKRIHPIQYCLLGGAILIFYLLLVSISEFLPFCSSYLIATLMILSMVFLYTHYVITKKQNTKFSFFVTFLMGILYLFFYLLLQLQDIALLVGSFALFGIIGAIMYTTRNVDWYKE